MLNEYKIIKCKALENYQLALTFADGKSGVIGLSHLVGKGVFSIWNDYAEFKRVGIDPVTKTVCWKGNIDLDPFNLRNNLY